MRKTFSEKEIERGSNRENQKNSKSLDSSILGWYCIGIYIFWSVIVEVIRGEGRGSKEMMGTGRFREKRSI